MIPLAIPDLSGNERKYLNKCIDSTYVSSVGPFVDRLESLIAEISGAKYGVAVSSGTTGLHTALTAYGVGRDDIVIIPSFTFIATANAISHCGATPWLMDIKSDSWCIRKQINSFLRYLR
ncbi:MAG: DegT/DnrJ/EryC1/StrS family aminotransferase [Lachnospiraceae bacterium]|nr:DegT/DnrJ/EryC1/StrS family aminotransferase [Lachnospiraceae bacterium]